MVRRLGAGGVALAALVATGTAGYASSKCARPSEVTAIQVAAIQQELMVAALTCDQTSSFNAFQTTYSKDLRRSDHRLKYMFRRLFGSRGYAQYHAFKTRLANNSSIRSIKDNRSFCKEARIAFAAALSPETASLADFVAGVPVHDDGPVESCDIRVANGLAGTRAIPKVVPKPNPLRVAALTPAPAQTTAPAPKAQSPEEAAETAAKTPEKAEPQQVQAQAAKPADDDGKTAEKKKKSGWFSNLF